MPMVPKLFLPQQIFWAVALLLPAISLPIRAQRFTEAERRPERSIRQGSVDSGSGTGFSPVNRALSRLTHDSGSIFTGKVIAVVSGDVQTMPGPGVSRITFHVDQGIRGVRSGQTITVREWIGPLLPIDRYFVGERVLLFLYPPSKLGLTSPVGGSLGRFNLDSAGNVVLRPEYLLSPLTTHWGRQMRPSYVKSAVFIREILRAAEQ